MSARILLSSAVYFLIAYLFATRENPKDNPTFTESVIPLISVFTPAILLYVSSVFEAQYSFARVGTSIIIGGLFITLLSLYRLKRSFAILPARREIIINGPYAVVRHPIYAGEITTSIGLLLTHLHYMGIVILILGILATIFRMNIEEKKLSVDEKYRKYKSKVTYKLIPLIW
ncbi:MAG: isoprenylcysteine carboxylmethyltransferase family protein [Candidatus Methanofastidiosia archaeon]|jgi:protein-S-isoprenylcysteine O-methyltransferase Ste14